MKSGACPPPRRVTKVWWRDAKIKISERKRCIHRLVPIPISARWEHLQLTRYQPETRFSDWRQRGSKDGSFEEKGGVAQDTQIGDTGEK